MEFQLFLPGVAFIPVTSASFADKPPSAVLNVCISAGESSRWIRHRKPARAVAPRRLPLLLAPRGIRIAGELTSAIDEIKNALNAFNCVIIPRIPHGSRRSRRAPPRPRRRVVTRRKEGCRGLGAQWRSEAQRIRHGTAGRIEVLIRPKHTRVGSIAYRRQMILVCRR